MAKMSQYLNLAMVLFAIIFFSGCSSSEEPDPIIDDVLFFEFTLNDVPYRSEIKIANLVPQGGFEYLPEPGQGMNFMFYNFFSGPLAITYSNNCGTSPGRDCLHFEFYLDGDAKVGVYNDVTNYSMSVNGQQYVTGYNGPNVNPEPVDLKTSINITKFDEANRIMEGTVNAQYYKDQDPSAKVYTLKAKFRVSIYKG